MALKDVLEELRKQHAAAKAAGNTQLMRQLAGQYRQAKRSGLRPSQQNKPRVQQQKPYREQPIAKQIDWSPITSIVSPITAPPTILAQSIASMQGNKEAANILNRQAQQRAFQGLGEIAGYATGGLFNKVASPIARGAIKGITGGMAAGGLYGAGEASAQGKTPLQAITSPEARSGVIAGGLFGGALGAGIPALSKTFGTVSSKKEALQTLGLTSNATTDQIKKRYRELVNVFHPDKGINPNAKNFSLISQAYKKLGGQLNIAEKAFIKIVPNKKAKLPISGLLPETTRGAGKAVSIENIINNPSLTSNQKLSQLVAIQNALPKDQKFQVPNMVLDMLKNQTAARTTPQTYPYTGRLSTAGGNANISSPVVGQVLSPSKSIAQPSGTRTLIYNKMIKYGVPKDIEPTNLQNKYLLSIGAKRQYGTNFNGYGYADKVRIYDLTPAQKAEYNRIGRIVKKPVKKLTEDEIKDKWANRLVKITGIPKEEALAIAQEKLDYKLDRIDEMVIRNNNNPSIRRERLIAKMERENPLRRIKDAKHAQAILEASKRHASFYETYLDEARELVKTGQLEPSEVKEYARQKYYEDREDRQKYEEQKAIVEKNKSFGTYTGKQTGTMTSTGEIESEIKRQIGDTFKLVKPINGLWESKGNVIYIKPNRDQPGYSKWLEQKNFIKKVDADGNGIYRVEVKNSGLPLPSRLDVQPKMDNVQPQGGTGQEIRLETGKSKNSTLAEEVEAKLSKGSQPNKQSSQATAVNQSTYRQGSTWEQKSIGQRQSDRAGREISQNRIGGAASLQDLVHGYDVKSKVGILDYFRTPTRVLEKIGLKGDAQRLLKANELYQKDVVNEIKKVTEWYKRVPSKESNVKIFKWLDGDKSIALNKEESKVAGEIKTYLAQWADKLNLPDDERIASYITHIFDDEIAQKEFSPEIAKLITDRVPGSVYDPFLEKRLGKLGYIEDTWRALDAYVKRATRKYNFDPALEILKNNAEKLEPITYKYIQKLAARINLRPTEIDSLIDNSVKQIVGYKFGARPVARVSRGIRNVIYRATLGLNLGSSIKNLTQGANTYAKLGEKYTLIGYSKLLKKWTTRDLDELIEQGVLSNDIIQDRSIKAVKKGLQKAEKGLWILFDTTEKINRGSAYYGAKAKALSEGKNESQAIEYAKKIVGDTQFRFNNVETPVALSSDLAKTIGQFQSYSTKQAEFLADLVKNKEYKGLFRYIGATLLATALLSQILGYDLTDAIPFYDMITGESRFSPPILRIAESAKEAVTDNVQKGIKGIAKLVVPAGTQIGKTAEGINALMQGASTTDKGNIRYPISQNPSNTIKTMLFGQYSTPEASEYFSKDRRPLSEAQTKQVQLAPNRQQAYIRVMEQRESPTIKLTTTQTKKANETWRSYLDGEISKEDAFKQLEAEGIDAVDSRYDFFANENNDTKRVLVDERIDAIINAKGGIDVDELIKLRKPGRNDNILLSDGIVDDLEEEGIISGYDGYVLKNTKYSRKTKQMETDITMDEREYAYDSATKLKTSERKAVVISMLNSGATVNDLIKLREDGKESGSRLLTDNILRELRDEGLITYSDWRQVYYSGKTSSSGSGSGSGSRKIKLGTTPKLGTVRVTPSKVSSPTFKIRTTASPVFKLAALPQRKKIRVTL